MLSEQTKQAIQESAKKYVNRIWADQTELQRERNTTIEHYIAIATPYADKLEEAEREIKTLKDWKESAMNILSTIDLQECGKILKLPLGSNIAKHILPGLRECERLRGGIKETIEWLQLHRPTMTGTGGPISILKQILTNAK